MKQPKYKQDKSREKVILIPKRDAEQRNKELKDKRSGRERG